MSAADFRTVTILHTEDAKAWCTYVVNKFSSDKLHLKIETLDVSSLDYENPPEIQVAVAESYVVMLLTTSSFLNYMEKQQHWFAHMLETRDKSITTIVAATIDIESEVLQEFTDKCNYHPAEQWEIKEIHVTGSNIMDFIADILGITDRNATTLAKRLPARTYSDPLRSHSEAKEPIQVIPDKIQKAGDKVVLIFSKEKAKDSVTIYAGGINIPVETVNPYCVTFKAPEITGTRITLQVYINNKLRRVKLYSNPVPQFTSVELMCQSYGVTKKEELDIKLAEKFTSSMCADNRALTILSEIYENTSTGTERHNNSQYPTLLHWAAANGLRELCSVLMSAPGANQACNILNIDGDDVSDLAEKNGYDDLSDYILEFTETKNIADACDLYVQCCRGPTEKTPLYVEMVNQFGKPAPPPVLPRSPPPVKPLPPRPSPSLDSSLPSPQEFISKYIQPVLPMAAIGSRSQTELIEIQEEVKKGTFSIREAEMLFSSWKARYETGNAISFKERQESLQALREQHKKAMDVLGAKTCKKKKKKGKKKKEPAGVEDIISISEPIGMRKTYETMFSYPGPARGDSQASHDSGRYSGRDSKLSQTSTSSEDVELEDEMPIMRASRSQSEKVVDRIDDSRLSKRDLYLKLVHNPTDVPESSPPPLPPRLKPLPPPVDKRPPRVYGKPPPPLLSKKPSQFKKQ